LVFSDDTNAVGSDATAVMPDATLVAALADATVTVNATVALAASSRRVVSVTPVTLIADTLTPSEPAIALMNAACAPEGNDVRPASAADDETV
jgi:hypothetical protein